jgi:hypothetical protein
MSKHTPGPWALSGTRLSYAPGISSDTRLLQVGPDGDTLALVFFDMQTGRGHKDARLIAAAPELLEALKEFVEWIEQGDYDISFLAKAQAAIAKAEGAQ